MEFLGVKALLRFRTEESAGGGKRRTSGQAIRAWQAVLELSMQGPRAVGRPQRYGTPSPRVNGLTRLGLGRDPSCEFRPEPGVETRRRGRVAHDPAPGQAEQRQRNQFLLQPSLCRAGVQRPGAREPRDPWVE